MSDGHKKISLQIKACREHLARLEAVVESQSSKGLVEARIKDFEPGKTILIRKKWSNAKDGHVDTRYRVVDVRRSGGYVPAGGYTVGLREIGRSQVFDLVMSGKEYFWVEKTA